jgi:hypothetical protein
MSSGLGCIYMKKPRRISRCEHPARLSFTGLLLLLLLPLLLLLLLLLHQLYASTPFAFSLFRFDQSLHSLFLILSLSLDLTYIIV